MSFLQKVNARILSSRNTQIPILFSFIIEGEEEKNLTFQKHKINYKLTFYKPRKAFQRQEAGQQPADGGWHVDTWLFVGEGKHNHPAKSFAMRLLARNPQNPVKVNHAKCKT